MIGRKGWPEAWSPATRQPVILHLTQSRGVVNMRHEYKTRSMAEFLAAMRNGGCVLWSSGGFPGGSIQGGGYVAIH